MAIFWQMGASTNWIKKDGEVFSLITVTKKTDLKLTYSHLVAVFPVQWPFQVPKFGVPIDWRYLPYVREYLHNSYGQKYGTFTYLHQLDLQ